MPKKDIIDQLRKIFEDMGTSRYTPDQDNGGRVGYKDTFVDFPYVEDPEPFKTHTSLEQDNASDEKPDLPDPGPEPSPPSIDDIEDITVKEQAMPDKPISPTPETAGADAGGEMPEGMGGEMGADAGMGGDMGAGMGGMGDMGMGMGGEPQQTLSSSQIGRVYELKKIYSRLSSVETYLARTTDKSILELRKHVSQSIDLFEVVITNFEQFKDKIDEVIIMFYEFLSIVYGSLRTYFNNMSNEKYQGVK